MLLSVSAGTKHVMHCSRTALAICPISVLLAIADWLRWLPCNLSYCVSGVHHLFAIVMDYVYQILCNILQLDLVWLSQCV